MNSRSNPLFDRSSCRREHKDRPLFMETQRCPDANLLPDINDVVTKEIAQWGGELGESHTKMRVRTFGDRAYLYQAGGQDNDFDHSEGSCFDTDSAALQARPRL
jgi:hypothetical protein